MRRTRKLLGALLALVMCLAMVPITALAAEPASNWLDGENYNIEWYTGETTTYTIFTAADFAGLAQLVNSGIDFSGCTVNLGANIDLSAHAWTPIGNSSSNALAGTFDGNGYTISNMVISGTYDFSSQSHSIGLFGYLTGSVTNLNVTGNIAVTVTAGEQPRGEVYVGGIAGQSSGTITNCGYSGSISYSRISGRSSGYIGGIVGDSSGNITGCCFDGAISGSGLNVGGIVGWLSQPNDEGATYQISNCYNIGTINSTQFVGGIAGVIHKNNDIINCYNAGTINGAIRTATGGIVGYSYGATKIETCYNVGTVIADRPIVGGASNSTTFTNCFYLANEETDTREGTTYKTAEEMSNQDTFNGWDFDSTWAMSDIVGRPVLRGNSEEGDGSAVRPFLIHNLEALADYAEKINNGDSYDEGKYYYYAASYKLTADIDMSGTYNATTGKSWEPIGTDDDSSFIGTFDGDGHSVSGLYCVVEKDFIGLFGSVGSGGTVKNLSASGQISGGEMVGGIVGQNTGVVINCTFSGTILDGDERIGGIVGRNYGTAENCYSTATVHGAENVGGVVGANADDATVINCYYLDGTASSGVGNETENAGAVSKTEEEFATGEITWQLQGTQAPQVWGQTIGSDALPVLTSEAAKSVLEVEFQNSSSTTIATRYANPNGTVDMPTTYDGCPAGQVVAYWNNTDSSDETQYTSNTSITGNLTLVPGVFAYAKPEGVSGGVNCITGVDSTMEYCADGDDTWTPITGTTVTDLAAGEYQVRVAASTDGSGSILASESVTVTVSDPYVPVPTYAITVESSDNGAVTASASRAAAGSRVSLTVNPNEGYVLDSLTVTDASGNEVSVSGSGSNYTFTMPASTVTVVATFIEEAHDCLSEHFTDVDTSAWYHLPVDYAVENGLMIGTSDTTFEPEATMSRAQLVTLLWRLEGEPVASCANAFDDVAEGE